MGSRSKLTERSVRLSDPAESRKELAVENFRAQVKGAQSESAKSHAFTVLLTALFGVKPRFIEDYVQGIEKCLQSKEKDFLFRGRADQLSGNLIIEFERDLSGKAKTAEAETQLRQYAACAWSEEGPKQRTPYVCLAADGRHFRAYAPVVREGAHEPPTPDDIELRLLEEIDAFEAPWRSFYFFLDRYLLRQEILPPTTEAIVKDFGPKSHAFQRAETALLRRWNEIKDHSDYAVLYEAWDKYLRIVYGSALGDRPLFVRHTYLASLAKLMVWSRLAGETAPPGREDILAILDGRYFKDRLGIENFLEEDFFSWVARPEAQEAALGMAVNLLDLLRAYNLRELSEDVLKSLYEGLVDPATRHDLGEYYTPDWLADRIVRRMLDENPEASALDPSCGSGTFLYMAVREKRRRLPQSAKSLNHILSSVVGLDIHPLACIVAKANYVLALGDLMTKRKEKVAIPVYLANSIRPPEEETRPILWHEVACYRAEIEGHTVHIPESLIGDPDRYDRAVEAARDFAVHHAGKPVDEDAFLHFLTARYSGLADDKAARILFSAAETMKGLIERGRDTIWAFVLKNIYKPVFLKERFDLLIGNPPWLSYRYVERSDYQRFLKQQIAKRYALVKDRPELVTHLELGTLFLVRCADLYLKPEGRVGFVLPKSIFSADQHDALRRGKTARVGVRPDALWDLEDVSPLFNISAAVFFGSKQRPAARETVPGEALRGALPLRNAGLDAAEKALEVKQVRFHLSEMGSRSFWTPGERRHTAESPYKKMFRQGATIVPRCFWFVDLQKSDLGFDHALPPLVSSERALDEAKKAYEGCMLRGTVESDFIYSTLLSVDLLPFGALCVRPVVLPVRMSGKRLHMLKASDARQRGYIHLAQWLENVEREWERRRGEKSKGMTAVKWLDYRHKLTEQVPTVPFRVLYAASGTNVCACALSAADIARLVKGKLRSRGFVADCTSYYTQVSEQGESHYVSAFLNAPHVNRLIKPSQAKGLWGARHVCKKILDLPIPRFNPKSAAHRALAELGEECAERVAKWVKKGGPGAIRSIGVLRSRVRVMLEDELERIDRIVRRLLGF